MDGGSEEGTEPMMHLLIANQYLPNVDRPETVLFQQYTDKGHSNDELYSRTDIETTLCLRTNKILYCM